MGLIHGRPDGIEKPQLTEKQYDTEIAEGGRSQTIDRLGSDALQRSEAPSPPLDGKRVESGPLSGQAARGAARTNKTSSTFFPSPLKKMSQKKAKFDFYAAISQRDAKKTARRMKAMQEKTPRKKARKILRQQLKLAEESRKGSRRRNSWDHVKEWDAVIAVIREELIWGDNDREITEATEKSFIEKAEQRGAQDSVDDRERVQQLNSFIDSENPIGIKQMVEQYGTQLLNTPDPNPRAKNERPLQRALALRDPKEVTKCLLDYGADFRQIKGVEPHEFLIYADGRGDPALTAIMLDSGQFGQPDTLLMNAIDQGNVDLARALVRSGKVDVNAQTPSGTPLGAAAEKGGDVGLGIAAILLDNGALNVKDSVRGDLPSNLASDNPDIAQKITETMKVNDRFDAAKYPRASAQLFLLLRVADDESPEEEMELRINQMKALVLQYGPGILNHKNNEGITILEGAIREKGNAPFVRALIENGADPKRIEDRFSLFSYLIPEGGAPDFETINILIEERGLDPNVTSLDGKKTILSLLKNAEESVAKNKLVSSLEKKRKASPFQKAIESGNLEAVNREIRDEPKRAKRFIYGINPAVLALERGHTHIFKRLVEAGALDKAYDEERSPTLLQFVDQKGNVELGRFLLSKGSPKEAAEVKTPRVSDSPMTPPPRADKDEDFYALFSAGPAKAEVPQATTVSPSFVASAEAEVEPSVVEAQPAPFVKGKKPASERSNVKIGEGRRVPEPAGEKKTDPESEEKSLDDVLARLYAEEETSQPQKETIESDQENAKGAAKSSDAETESEEEVPPLVKVVKDRNIKRDPSKAFIGKHRQTGQKRAGSEPEESPAFEKKQPNKEFERDPSETLIGKHRDQVPEPLESAEMDEKGLKFLENGSTEEILFYLAGIGESKELSRQFLSENIEAILNFPADKTNNLMAVFQAVNAFRIFENGVPEDMKETVGKKIKEWAEEASPAIAYLEVMADQGVNLLEFLDGDWLKGVLEKGERPLLISELLKNAPPEEMGITPKNIGNFPDYIRIEISEMYDALFALDPIVDKAVKIIEDPPLELLAWKSVVPDNLEPLFASHLSRQYSLTKSQWDKLCERFEEKKSQTFGDYIKEKSASIKEKLETKKLKKQEEYSELTRKRDSLQQQALKAERANDAKALVQYKTELDELEPKLVKFRMKNRFLMELIRG